MKKWSFDFALVLFFCAVPALAEPLIYRDVPQLSDKEFNRAYNGYVRTHNTKINHYNTQKKLAYIDIAGASLDRINTYSQLALTAKPLCSTGAGCFLWLAKFKASTFQFAMDLGNGLETITRSNRSIRNLKNSYSEVGRLLSAESSLNLNRLLAPKILPSLPDGVAEWNQFVEVRKSLQMIDRSKLNKFSLKLVKKIEEAQENRRQFFIDNFNINPDSFGDVPPIDFDLSALPSNIIEKPQNDLKFQLEKATKLCEALYGGECKDKQVDATDLSIDVKDLDELIAEENQNRKSFNEQAYNLSGHIYHSLATLDTLQTTGLVKLNKEEQKLLNAATSFAGGALTYFSNPGNPFAYYQISQSFLGGFGALLGEGASGQSLYLGEIFSELRKINLELIKINKRLDEINKKLDYLENQSRLSFLQLREQVGEVQLALYEEKYEVLRHCSRTLQLTSNPMKEIELGNVVKACFDKGALGDLLFPHDKSFSISFFEHETSNSDQGREIETNLRRIREILGAYSEREFGVFGNEYQKLLKTAFRKALLVPLNSHEIDIDEDMLEEFVSRYANNPVTNKSIPKEYRPYLANPNEFENYLITERAIFTKATNKSVEALFVPIAPQAIMNFTNNYNIAPKMVEALLIDCKWLNCLFGNTQLDRTQQKEISNLFWNIEAASHLAQAQYALLDGAGVIDIYYEILQHDVPGYNELNDNNLASWLANPENYFWYRLKALVLQSITSNWASFSNFMSYSGYRFIKENEHYSEASYWAIAYSNFTGNLLQNSLPKEFRTFRDDAGKLRVSSPCTWTYSKSFSQNWEFLKKESLRPAFGYALNQDTSRSSYDSIQNELFGYRTAQQYYLCEWDLPEESFMSNQELTYSPVTVELFKAAQESVNHRALIIAAMSKNRILK
ncbi:hypothetical protein AN214_04024 [Pseudoalteromonas sp. P1-9]|uniref:hypothetical protein n=1 Tax=Pseudoalteromonas sp. P1-9 TaxID=1710354 RepID=UPI0006D63E9D|nr:hypothetical protein [Pseudoalteromonas sp. P1-9]KPV93925.1 hypothetical protein AN214_04024 [Pseudoalteromonas sp. P1-9]